LGKELGKDLLKKLQNARKCLQMARAHLRCFLVLFQKDVKSFEENKKCSIQVLSLGFFLWPSIFVHQPSNKPQLFGV
jgi:hypothetical protein